MLSLLTTRTANWVIRHAKETPYGNIKRKLEALRSRLEMEFSYTAQSLPTSAEYVAFKQAVVWLIFLSRMTISCCLHSILVARSSYSHI